MVSFTEYIIYRRVEEEMRGKFLKSVRESKPVTDRKRKYRENKKERERAKKQSKLEDRTDDWGKLRDDVKFGEVADAPPILNAIPKARGAAKKVNIIFFSLRLVLFIDMHSHFCRRWKPSLQRL
jgi:hypothetical protein